MIAIVPEIVSVLWWFS